MSASNCKSFLRSRMSLTKIWLRLQPAIAGGRTLWFQMNFQTVQSRPKWFPRCRIKKQQIIIRSELNLTVGQQKHQPPRIPPFFLFFPDSALLLIPPPQSLRWARGPADKLEPTNRHRSLLNNVMCLYNMRNIHLYTYKILYIYGNRHHSPFIQEEFIQYTISHSNRDSL